MDFLIPLSIGCIAIGVMGLLGFSKRAPKKFRDKPWTKQYIKYESVAWIALGVLYILSYFVGSDDNSNFGVLGLDTVILLLSLIPTLIYSIWVDRKFSARLKEEAEKNHPKE